jgi:hypothetical protein
MTLDEAIEQVKSKISAASKGAQMKAVKMSGEEARLTVLAPAADLQTIKDATFKPVLDLLNNDGLDIQVLVYDKDAPPLDV